MFHGASSSGLVRAVTACGVVLSLGACAPEDGGGVDVSEPDELVGQNAVARTMTVEGAVLVAPSASAATILAAVRRQTRSLFGPLRSVNVSLDDREIRTIDTSTFKREPVSVVDTDNPGAAARPMLRVRYTYTGRGVVPKAWSRRRSLSTTALFGDYLPYASELIAQCTDDPHAREWGGDGLWYMFNPEVARCGTAIRAEVSALDAAQRKLTDRRAQVSAREAARRFLPLSVRLATIRSPETVAYPEYDQLLGAGNPAKTSVNVYAFFGVIGDHEADPRDEGYREMFFVLRNVLRAFPHARFEAPSPATNLLDLRVDGAAVPNVTHAAVIDWALGGSAPSGVGVAALRQAILDTWKRRAIRLTVPMNVTVRGQARAIDLRIHTYYGEEGAWNSGARERYVAAWRDADVFAYSGHSHIGAGPLDPSNYRASDFPDRYQIMMINSCVSFNYYNRDFYPLHPGGSAKLDLVVNGIEAYSDNGHAVSSLITGLFDGRQQSYLSLLRGMIANEPDIGLEDYDPMRVADGETDNRYSPRATPLTLTPRR